MVCPGCGGSLEHESVVEFDYSYRCSKCGGWWVPNWVVNNIADGRVVAAKEKAGLADGEIGKNLCPIDKTMLSVPGKGTVPDDLAVQKCSHCGWWWFPGNEIFKFSRAFEVKKSYVKLWNKNDWMAYAWPALVLVLMLLGVGGGVWLVRQRQQVAVPAAVGVREFLAVQRASGVVEVRFKSEVVVGEVEYCMAERRGCVVLKPEVEGEFYVVRLAGLEPGKYVMQVVGREYEFEVR